MKKLFLVFPILLLFFHLMYATDGPQVWTQDLTGAGNIWQGCVVINPANTQIMYAGSNGAGVWKTTNGGANWTPAINGLTVLTIQALAISHSNPSVLYAGTATAGMFKTTDAGGNWVAINTGITQTPNSIQCIDVNPTDPTKAVIGIWDGSTTVDAAVGLYRTTDGGTTWLASNTGMALDKNILSVVYNPLNGNTVYAGSSFIVSPAQAGPCYVYKSYDGGATWFNSSTGFGTATTDTDPIRSLSIGADTTTLLAGRFLNTANGGPWVSTNAGASWTQKVGGIPPPATYPGPLIRAAYVRSSTEMFFGGDYLTNLVQPGGVWRTTDGGTTWADFNGGSLSNQTTVRALNFRNSTDMTLFAGVAGATTPGVFEYTFAPNGVIDPNNGAPKEFALKQNYPNPFNPSTVIEFALPKSSFVTVKVYNSLGQEIKTLISEQRQAGNFVLNFNASSLPSGVYFYKLTAGDFVSTKKMMLVK